MFNKNRGTGYDALDQILKKLGYAYDAEQNIFYSTLNAWQRKYGYCRLYDEAAPLFSMIMDCEPIKFEYGGRRWLIQFWKGQYALACGCELGVYSTSRPDLDLPGVYKGPLYEAVADQDLLPLSFTLYKKGEPLFSREEKHWWLTGFILGEFSEPHDLTLNLAVTFYDQAMMCAFVDGLRQAGYSRDEISIFGKQVCLMFAQPRTPQPSTRNPLSDHVIQRKNEMLCQMFQKITREAETMPAKLELLKKRAPRLFNQVLNAGKTTQLFERHEALLHYLR